MLPPGIYCIWEIYILHIKNKSALDQVMACFHYVISHYLSQCWPSSLMPSGITRHQWKLLTQAWFPTWTVQNLCRIRISRRSSHQNFPNWFVPLSFVFKIVCVNNEYTCPNSILFFIDYWVNKISKLTMESVSPTCIGLSDKRHF